MSDYQYLPVSDGSGDASLMHLISNRAHGSSVYSVDSVIGVPANFIATCGTLLPTGFIDPTTKVDFKGHVSGSTLIIDAFEPGSVDPTGGNTSGQVIVVKPNTGWANRVANFIKNATNLGTPEPHTVSTLTATGVTTGTLATSGNSTLGGVVQVTGQSYNLATGVSTVDGSGNITPTSQVFRISGLASTAVIQVPSYIPQDGMTGELRIYDNGGAQSMSWASGWKPIALTLPTSTTPGQFIYISYEYSSFDSKWHVLSVARG